MGLIECNKIWNEKFKGSNPIPMYDSEMQFSLIDQSPAGYVMDHERVAFYGHETFFWYAYDLIFWVTNLSVGSLEFREIEIAFRYCRFGSGN